MINWHAIDTVLLDMDGTLLDLHYDNYFWLTHLPKRYAEIHNTSMATAKAKLEKAIESKRGTLDWYCLDFWSNSLQVDVVKLKAEVKDKINVRPHAHNFLEFLVEKKKQAILVTNAHPQSLSLKLAETDIDKALSTMISSHEFKQPKEAQAFWHALRQRIDFDPEKTLFIDDTKSILLAAKTYGIAHILGIHQPDSKIERRLNGVPAIYHFDEIM